MMHHGSSVSGTLTLNTTEIRDDRWRSAPVFIVTLAVCYCVALWTICMHGLLILCFYVNRDTIWVKKAKGTLSLIITDFLSGLSFLLLIKAHTTSSSVQWYACILPSGLYMNTQLLTSLQILRICVFRLRSTLKKTPNRTESTRSTVTQFLALFLASGAVVATPLCLVQWRESYPTCSLENITGENFINACIFMLVTLAVPNFATTGLYFSIICVLKAKSASVHPTTELQTETGGHMVSSTRMEPMGRPKESENIVAANKTERSRFNFAIKKYWRKAVVNIGLVLLLNNISLTPYICVLSFQIAYGVTGGEAVPAQFWFVSGFILQSNSALSPFVYVLRVKEIHIAFRKMLQRVFCKCWRYG